MTTSSIHTAAAGETTVHESSGSASLEVRNVEKQYGRGSDARQVLADVTFTVSHGEFVTIVGPSGAGKTTLLRCLAGLLAPDGGEVYLRGERVVSPPEGMAVVFQDYSRSLMPWLKIIDNTTLPLLGRKMSKRWRRELALGALAAVGLGEASALYPWQMSGGMQQRAAIARALVCEPEVLLMDEPFASVDAQTRADLEDLILRLQRDLDITIVLVTHDIDEAVYLADRVIVLSGAPTTVTEIVEVSADLGRDRDQVATKLEPEFGTLRAHVLGLVRH